MANTGMTIPDDVLDEFDAEIWELQKGEVIKNGRMRSQIITAMIEDVLDDGLHEFVQDHPELLLGTDGKNRMTAAVTAD